MPMGKSSKTQRNANKTRHRVKPAELYRTDFITAMKLPDNEVLDDDAYWLIRDPWKLDWEKGVQVPIKPTELNNANSKLSPIDLQQSNTTLNKQLRHLTFKLPKKYLCPANDPNFDVNIHEAYITHRLIDDICRYDSDELDVCWLNRINLEFQLMGIEQLTRINFERIIENFETQTHENLKEAIKTLESYSIEYDEEVVCDVCRSPDSEDTNEMVFCDGCNLCVHQACYGIEKIPKGSWLCAPCQLSLKPQCILCPNSGGALKATRNLSNWCHVSCALWIPEVGFGNPDKMEPIVNINKIPPARWQLLCHLCKEKRGCCFQCSEKKCHSAFHITCAFKNNLEMQTILGHREDDIVFKAYCLKHSRKRQRYVPREQHQQQSHHPHHHHHHNQHLDSTKSHLTSSPSSSLNQDLCKLNEQERKRETEKRIQKLDLEFYKYSNPELTCDQLKLNKIHIDYVFNYWKLKRRYKQNKPLLIPKADEDLMNQSERLLNARIKMFIHLRQDLERVRNLCYMVIKREKLKKRYFQLKTNIFYKQCEFIQKYGVERSGRTKDILSTKHVNCIYDDFNLDNNNTDVNLNKLNDNNKIMIDDDGDNNNNNNNNNDDNVNLTQSSSPTIVDNLEQIQKLDQEIDNLKKLNNKNILLLSSPTTTPINNNSLIINNELINNISNESLIENKNTKNKKLFKSSTNLVTKSLNNKKKSLTNQIKSKYKNIHLNNYLASVAVAAATAASSTTINTKNGLNKNNIDLNQSSTITKNQLKRRSTSENETLKLLNNDINLKSNGYLNSPSSLSINDNNNKKLKLTANKNTPASSPNLNNNNNNKTPANNRMRFSLRSSTSAKKPPVMRSPSIKRTNSKQDLNYSQSNRITTRLTYENGSF